MRTADLPQKTVAGCLYQVEYMSETIGTTVIGIGHLLFLPGIGEGKKQAEMPQVIRRTQGFEVSQVAVVHSQDVVKTLEIRRAHLPGSQWIQVIAAFGGLSTSTSVAMSCWSMRLANTPWAVGERQILPRQTKSTDVIGIPSWLAGAKGNYPALRGTRQP
jgi:hypothetical protein